MFSLSDEEINRGGNAGIAEIAEKDKL